MTESEQRELEQCFLFEGVKRETYLPLLEKKAKKLRFSKGEVIYDRDHFERAAGFLLSGAVLLEKVSEEKTVLLGKTETGGMFGVAALFGEPLEYVTKITAAEDSEILFFGGALLTEIFTENPAVSMNYIRFLSEKIRLLNRKIDRYALQSPEAKLASYLQAAQTEGGLTLKITLSDLAKTLSISRAALYRVLSSMEEEAVFVRRGKKIENIDHEKLKLWI